jgi:hypothetical protein
LALGSPLSALSAAPLPRPPQPMSPTLMMSLPAARTPDGNPKFAATAAAPATAAVFFTNSRRVALWGASWAGSEGRLSGWCCIAISMYV